MGSGIVAGLVLAVALNSVVQKWAQGNARDPLILLAGTALLGGGGEGVDADLAGAPPGANSPPRQA